MQLAFLASFIPFNLSSFSRVAGFLLIKSLSHLSKDGRVEIRLLLVNGFGGCEGAAFANLFM